MGGKAVTVTDADFETSILKAEQPAVVDFWAVWCGPCKAVGPIVEEVAEQFDGRAIVAKVDVDSNQGIAKKYFIQAIPTLLFLKNGRRSIASSAASTRRPSSPAWRRCSRPHHFMSQTAAAGMRAAASDGEIPAVPSTTPHAGALPPRPRVAAASTGLTRPPPCR
jgi:thioredoxin 1